VELIEGHRPIQPAEGIPVWDVDPYSDANLTNPNLYWEELRSKGGVVYIPRYSVLAVGRYLSQNYHFDTQKREERHGGAKRRGALSNQIRGKRWSKLSL